MGHTLIVGRKTFELLPPLPGRDILLLSRQLTTPTINQFGVKGELITKPTGLEDAIVAGGKEVYSLYMPYINEFYVSYIKGDVTGDTIMEKFEHRFPYSSVIKDEDDIKIVRYSTNHPL